MREEGNLSRSVDWFTVTLYAIFVTFGWLNIYAAVYDPEAFVSAFDQNYRAGQQLMWIGLSSVVILMIMVVDYKFYSSFSYVIYGFIILLLLATFVFAPDIKGSRSWLVLGPIRLQPAEFAKFATALAVARFLGDIHVKFSQLRTKLILAAIIGLPAIIILAQNETGSMLVLAAFVIVMYREGMSPYILVFGILSVALFIMTLIFDKYYLIGSLGFITLIILVNILLDLRKKNARRKPIYQKSLIAIGGYIAAVAVIFSVNFFVNDVLQPHQQNRIKALIDPMSDIQGIGWNLYQSKVAIGSGQFWGKGFLQGTQTKFDFVPEQSTDFIFCTIGEEHGWLGSSLFIVAYIVFLCRLLHLAERQKDKFSRIYGYSVSSIFFFHFMVNIGMTIGVFPIIGIPLPFFSYGGSSLLGFTILLFVFLKLDAHRKEFLWH
jgi:rod shape determining protein RodA